MEAVTSWACGHPKMDAIFHERQDGALCAQHCLNALLQGPYFTAVDLGAIAQHLDDEERMVMAEGDLESEEYKNFLKQPSANMDDSGFFSVQVLSHALGVWGLRLVPFLNPEMKYARENPQYQDAFICNLQQHWLTIRKLGEQWFNLNSLLAKPDLISHTYLGMFLTQLQVEGYSIFVVVGDLPKCEAQELLSLCPGELQHMQSSPPVAGLSDKRELMEPEQQAEPSVDVEDLRRKRELYFAEKTTSTDKKESEGTQGTSCTDVGSDGGTKTAGGVFLRECMAMFTTAVRAVAVGVV